MGKLKRKYYHSSCFFREIFAFLYTCVLDIKLLPQLRDAQCGKFALKHIIIYISNITFSFVMPYFTHNSSLLKNCWTLILLLGCQNTPT